MSVPVRIFLPVWKLATKPHNQLGIFASLETGIASLQTAMIKLDNSTAD
jgi:hypothetical protein